MENWLGSSRKWEQKKIQSKKYIQNKQTKKSKNFLALINTYTHSQTKSNHDFITRHIALKLQKSMKKVISWATRKKKKMRTVILTFRLFTNKQLKMAEDFEIVS